MGGENWRFRRELGFSEWFGGASGLEFVVFNMRDERQARMNAISYCKTIDYTDISKRFRIEREGALALMYEME